MEYLKLTIGSKFELLHSCWRIFYFGKVVFEFLNIPEFFLNFMGFISTFYEFILFSYCYKPFWHYFPCIVASFRRCTGDPPLWQLAAPLPSGVSPLFCCPDHRIPIWWHRFRPNPVKPQHRQSTLQNYPLVCPKSTSPPVLLKNNSFSAQILSQNPSDFF